MSGVCSEILQLTPDTRYLKPVAKNSIHDNCCLELGGADMAYWLNLGQIQKLNAKKFPDTVALKDKTRAFTYPQMNQRVNQLANSLFSLGLKKGDKVAVLLENRDRRGVSGNRQNRPHHRAHKLSPGQPGGGIYRQQLRCAGDDRSRSICSDRRTYPRESKKHSA